jgi:hypothetical protein
LSKNFINLETWKGATVKYKPSRSLTLKVTSAGLRHFKATPVSVGRFLRGRHFTATSSEGMACSETRMHTRFAKTPLPTAVVLW